MKLRGAECTDLRCKSSRCVGPRPKTCPPGCPKRRVIHMMPEKTYRGIHAAPPPGGCLDCTRKEPWQSSYHKSRLCPLRSKPIPPKPLGGPPDRYVTETFLDTFDCQEQPWRSSSQKVSTHHEHSYQDLFRPSVSQGKLMGDNFGDFAIAELKPWKSSEAYIPCAHVYGKPWQWRSCVRYLGEKYCKEKPWRPSVHSCAPLEGDVEKPYRSQIVVKGGAYAADTETTEGPFRPMLRYIPEFYPNRRDWRPSRAHVCTKKCYHNLPKFEHLYNPVPAFETQQKLPPRDLRKRNALFSKQFPLKSQLHDMQAHDDPPDFMPQANEEGQLLPRNGKKPIPWTARSNLTYDGKGRTRRRIISSGHVDHLDASCLCVCKKKDAFRPTIRIVDGPQYHSVCQRNVLAGPLEPGHEKLPRFRTIIGPKPMGRPGSFNEDILAGRFHRCKMPLLPVSGALDRAKGTIYNLQALVKAGDL